MAAKRLHLSLLRIGLGSKLFTGRRDSSDEGGETAFDNSNFVWRNFAALRLSWANRITVRDGLFTEPGWIRRTQLQSLSTRPDVVNLHWVSRWLDVPSFLKSLPSLLPVVWSLHDMNPFTGGCHHAGDCDRFTRGCGGCPRLRRPGENDASRRGFLTKQRLYARRNIHFVGNSEWTTNQAKRSGLASSVHSFHTIPLGIDVDKYQPVSKASARDILRIPHGRFVVGFACPDFGDPNKGGTLLVKAVRALAEQHVVTVVAFGAGRLPEIGRGVEVIELGVVKSARLQSAFYSALDVFVSPSRIETFGLTAQEAMACGTPVLAFRTGGLPEVVADGETGLLEEKVGDVCGLVQKLLWFMHHPAERLAMGLAARKRVENHFTDRLFAERYCKLYGELVRIEAC